MSELLGGEAIGFIGFDAVSGGNSEGNDIILMILIWWFVGGASNVSDDILLRVDTTFQVVLKQLGKRDTTTKLKVFCNNNY